MFTGLVEEMGTVRERVPSAAGARMVIGCDVVREGLAIGDSVSVNGACLTVVQLTDDSFAVDCVEETLRRTSVGDRQAGDRVNLERAMREGDRLGGRVALLPIDVVRVEADGRTAWFAAHLLARHGWWRSRIVAAMNAQHRGTWDVAPRSHPNDGRVDLVEVAASMTPRDRWRASRRIEQGTHVPHPAISVRQVTTATVAFEAPVRLWLDGVPWGSAASFTLTVEPDAFTVCV